MNIDNNKAKATDPKGRKLPKGMSYRRNRYCVKIKDRTGNRPERWFETYNEANTYLIEVQHQKNKGITPANDKMTVNALFEQFCETFSANCRPGTLASYKKRYNVSIQPCIGNMKVIGVKYSDCQGVLNRMHTEGYGKGKKYARKTIENVAVVLSKMFQFAVRDDLLVKSPAESLNIPRDAKESEETPYLETQDIHRFLDTVSHLSVYPQLVLLLETGLRVAELAGLKWSDVDFDKNVLKVERNLNYINYQWCFGPPKSRNGKRIVPLTDQARKILKDQREKDLALPAAPGFEDIIFRSRTGKPVHYTTYNNILREICARPENNLPKLSVHGLRHTFTTAMRLHGMDPLTLDKITGHTARNITDSVYVHITPEIMQNEMRRTRAKLEESIQKSIASKAPENGENVGKVSA